MRLPDSLRARVLASVLISVTLVWLVAMVLLYREAQHEVDELLDADLTQVATLLLQVSHHESDNQEDLPELVEHGTEEHAMVFQIFGSDHTLLTRSIGAPATPFMNAALMNTARDGFYERVIGETRWRIVIRTDREYGIRVAVADRLDARRTLASRLGRRLTTPLLVGLPLIALWLAWVIQQALNPIKRIADEVSQRPGEDLSRLPERIGPSEMRPLLHAFNKLLARISATRERERRFTADAAHELRTPLAALRTQAQVAIRARNTDELQTALARILQGVDRSTHLVQQLLTLARLENTLLSPLPIEPGKLLRDAIGHASASAAAKGIDLGLGSAPENDTFIAGQETLLSVALRNLLENAIRYTPAGGRVDVHCQQSGPTISLIVEDSGPGMDAEEQSRACQAFFRGSASEDIAGSGLGLSIVERIAELHGGSLAFAKSTLGGLAVILQLPLRSPPPS